MSIQQSINSALQAGVIATGVGKGLYNQKQMMQQQIESNQKEYDNYCKEEKSLQKQLESIQEENNQIIQILNNKTIYIARN